MSERKFTGQFMRKDGDETPEAEEIVGLIEQLLLSDDYSELEKAQVLERLAEIVREDLGTEK
jgi:hypothetical protein